ncbi:uncharacterized protein EV422DRAFT_381494 [Fimicolochytrium jonesii]|uniref:uncharacterized protein n=1 Tax=Fimicolochytrium jonesii TaxID=1396493 RepID=UPI0022FF3A84|nr:uncharacterized protein EV422DRAFT_381494 [Fimicolochytrium jonesii]KAI8822859.1 hypothetical protein EV422DRAFT_381494 [Fimicolochytrium jonesii]
MLTCSAIYAMRTALIIVTAAVGSKLPVKWKSTAVRKLPRHADAGTSDQGRPKGMEYFAPLLFESLTPSIGMSNTDVRTVFLAHNADGRRYQLSMAYRGWEVLLLPSDAANHEAVDGYDPIHYTRAIGSRPPIQRFDQSAHCLHCV